MKPIWIKHSDGTTEERQFESASEVDKQFSGRPKTRVSLDGQLFNKFKNVRAQLDGYFRNGDSREASTPTLAAVAPAPVEAKPSEPAAGAGAAAPAPTRFASPSNVAEMERRILDAVGPINELTAEMRSELGSLRADVLELRRVQSEDNLQKKVEEFNAVADTKLARISKMREKLEQSHDELIDTIDQFQPGKVRILEQQLENLRVALQRQEGLTADERRKVDSLEREIGRLRVSPDSSEIRRLEALREQHSDIQSRLTLEDENARLRSTLAELEAREANYQRARKREQQEDDALRQNAVLMNDVADLEAQLRERELELEQQVELRRSVVRSRDAYASRLIELTTSHDKKVAELTTKLDESTRSLESSRCDFETERNRAQALEVQLQAHVNERDAFHADRQKWARQKTEQLLQLKREHQELREQLQQRYEGLEATLKANYQTREAAINREVEGRYEADLAAAREAVSRLNTGLTNRQAELDRARRELTTIKQEHAEWQLDEGQRRAAVAHAEKTIAQWTSRARDLEEQYKTKLESLSTAYMQRQQECEDALSKLRAEKAALEESTAVLQATLEGLRTRHDDLVRFIELQQKLRAELEKTKVDRDARVRDIEAPIPTMHGGISANLAVSAELEWLDQIESGLRKAQFVFPRRLLHAFHTSLKIANWAPLTVLAGVSGTGKSELPRLYARYGGLRFLSVPVQPNWDSPQDLFGFFNYLDGRYKATDFLRALVESQKTPSGEYGFNDAMLLVLLDEMNLARIELYFSELLSRLELRRGDDQQLRDIRVDIGAGVEPYVLSLGDNVMYTGTMNEDETTQSLSDKVLDRGNVITFPRPNKLAPRDVSSLGDRSEYLPFATWKKWIVPPERVGASVGADVHEKLRNALDTVNRALGGVNRAIGHRVFQAIEYYVANHPLVASKNGGGAGEDWKRAVEDQLAQKIMPKLRGVDVETEAGRTCLGEIERVLADVAPLLVDDFKKSCRMSEGAFTWSSAEYLQQE